MNRYPDVETMLVKIICLMPLVLTVLSASTVWSHGPKGHGNAAFTAIEAAKKGMQLYDRLLESGKLVDPWETELSDIKVFTRNNNKTK